MTRLQTTRKVGQILTISAIAVFVLASLGSAIVAPAPPGTAVGKANGPTLAGAMNSWDDGSAIRYNESGAETWRYERDVESVGSVERTPNGNVLLAYIRTPPNQTDEEMLTGVRIVDPDTKATVWQYEFEVPWLLNHEVHDAELLPNGDVAFIDMGEERVVVVDRETKQIEWEWHAADYYQAPPNHTRIDWLHSNDVDYIGDGRFLVSVRNANQLLVIERGEGVVEVVNEDRDDSDDHACKVIPGEQMAVENPRCGDPDVLRQQHNPQWLGDGRILVADSENDRIVELERQPNGTWVPTWTDYGARGLQYNWPRDADRLPNGHTLVTDTRNGRIVEIDRDGNVVWATGEPPTNVYEADRFGQEYPAGPTYEGVASPAPPVKQPIHLVNVVHGGAVHTLGRWLPHWFSAWHVLLAIVSLLWATVGLWLQSAAIVGSRLVTPEEATDASQ